MKKFLCFTLVLFLSLGTFTGCGSQKNSSSNDPIVFVWYPNASTRDLEEARNELGKIVEDATSREVEHLLTTDYAILIEALANDKADLCLAGLQTYIEANSKNPEISPLVIPSGPSGTLDDAMYYSWLAVEDSSAQEYMEDGKYKIDNIQGKSISFVSSSSTSGFKIASGSIIGYFGQRETWNDLKPEDLMEGGSDKFFKEVLFSGSHQISAVNLITKKADIANFADIVFNNYGEFLYGEPNTPGAVYRVKEDAAEPFDSLGGETFTLIGSLPVPNDHIIMNKTTLSGEEQKKLIEAFTSDEVSNNPKIFLPEESDRSGFLVKTSKECFLPVEEKWFDHIMELSKY